MTYEGLLDDSFKINAGNIEVPSNDPTKPKRVKLSNEDKVRITFFGNNFDLIVLHASWYELYRFSIEIATLPFFPVSMVNNI